MKKLMKVITNWLLAVSAWCAMVTTAFGAHIDPVEKALGEGTIEGTTLTVSTPVYYGSGFPAHCNQRGWYAGVTVKWGQGDTKANGFKVSVTTSGNLHDVGEFAPLPGIGTEDQSPDGSGISCKMDTYWATRYMRQCDWYVWLTETDAECRFIVI